MHTRLALLAILMPLCAAGTPSLTTAQELSEGREIRVGMLSGEVVTGSFLWLRADTLWYWSPANETVGVPLDAIDRLEVRVRRSARSGALRWGPVGLIVGGLLGAAGCLPDGERCKTSPDESTASAVLGSAFFVGVPLAVVGVALGVRFPGQRWEPIPPPFESAAVRP